MTIDDDFGDDSAQYAALEREMEDAAVDEGFEAGPGEHHGGADLSDKPHRRDEPDDDSDAVERAMLQADEMETELRQRWQEQQRYRAPDPYEDPLGYVHSVNQKVESITQMLDHHRFMGTVEKAENEFVAKTPDYHDAAEHLEKSRRNELAAIYPDRSPHAHLMARRHGFQNPAQLRDAIFANDAKTVAMQAMQAGVNPAEAYYNLAKGRGYTPKGGRFPIGGKSGRSGAGRSGGGSKAVDKLLNLYGEDGEAFDREWEKLARAGALG